MRLALAALISVLIAAISMAPSSAADQSTGPPRPFTSDEERPPIREDRPRGFEPARAGDSPTPEMPGLSTKEAEEARRELAAFDLEVGEAMMKADEANRGVDGEPVRPQQVGPTIYEPDTNTEPGPFYGEPASLEEVENGTYPPSTAGQGNYRSSGPCSGTNCYQSDRLDLSDPGNTMYAIDYQVWLAIPQANEWNKCDSTSSSSGCFWFYSTQNDMDSEPYSSSAMHIGPRRGVSAAGSAGPNWKMIISGYISGSYIGGQASTNLPVATWMRVRVWRLSSGYDSSAPYTPWSTWGVWALWNGTDHYLGSLTIDGHYIKRVGPFMEVMESNGQCSTDLERGYFNNFRYWQGGTSNASFQDAWADYETNCSNTSWHALGGDFVRDERETTRTIADGAQVW